MWQLRYIYDHLPTLTVDAEVKEAEIGRHRGADEQGSAMGLKGNLSRAKRTGRTLAVAGVTLATMALTFAGIAGIAGASSIPTGGTKTSGGTVRWAEPPGTPPTYIFPFMSAQNSSVDNISQFQYLMYRPLYMFGFPGNNHTTLNPKLSLASPPTYSNNDTTATIAMKNYKWSDGETVTASDVRSS